jgi:hypothetical protein
MGFGQGYDGSCRRYGILVGIGMVSGRFMMFKKGFRSCPRESLTWCVSNIYIEEIKSSIRFPCC